MKKHHTVATTAALILASALTHATTPLPVTGEGGARDDGRMRENRAAEPRPAQDERSESKSSPAKPAHEPRIAQNETIAESSSEVPIGTSSSQARDNERGTAREASAMKITFNIPAAPLSESLRTLGNQTKTNLLFDPQAVANVHAPAISDATDIETVLKTLLKDTGLTYKFVDTHTITLIPLDDDTRASLNTENAGPVHLAQNTGDTGTETPVGVSSGENKGREESSSTSDTKEEAMDEVVITGSHIRGESPVGAQLIIIDAEEIARSGYTRTEDAVRSLPQNFSGGPSNDSVFSSEGGREVSTNHTQAAAANLRGLGAGATLLMIDGRRVAPSGEQGLFAAMSSIPLTAVERIEVLPDGASALYGSDAIGGVVNVILRRDYHGGETQLKLGTVTEGSMQDLRIGQVLGTHWESGRGMFSYEYLDRDPLLARDRSFAADSGLIVNPINGRNLSSESSNPGTIVVEGRSWAIPPGQDGRTLTAADLVEGSRNWRNRGEHQWLTPEETRHSVFGSVAQDLNQRSMLSFQGLYSQRKTAFEFPNFDAPLFVPSSNPFYVNPTGGSDPVQVDYNFTDDFGPANRYSDAKSYSIAGTLSTLLPSDWRVSAEIDYALQEESSWSFVINNSALSLALEDPNSETAFNPFGDGSFTNPSTLAAIQANRSVSVDTDIWTSSLSSEGALASIPGGDIRLAVGGQYRMYGLDSVSSYSYEPGTLTRFRGDRDVRSLYAELRFPIVGERNRYVGVERMALALAVRYDGYSDFGGSTNPKVSFTWAPLKGLSVRGSVSKSFKAPELAHLDESSNGSFIVSLPSQNGIARALLWSGTNAGLSPERATSWSAGLDIAPNVLPTLRLGATYYDIDYTDRISSAFTGIGFSNFLRDPAVSDFVIHSPSAAQRERVCNSSIFGGVSSACLSEPIDAIVDLRLQNVAIFRNRGLDLTGSYGLDTKLGLFSFGINSTYILEYAQAPRITAPLSSLLNIEARPVDFKVRGSFLWSRSSIAAGAYVNHTDNYVLSKDRPDPVSSLTSVDLFIDYKFDAESGPLSHSQIVLNAQNVFDRDPPFVPNFPAYDGGNADPWGRVISIQVRKGW